MKKKTFKLTMNKETLRRLTSTETRAAAAGYEDPQRDGGSAFFSKCETYCYTCHPECTLA